MATEGEPQKDEWHVCPHCTFRSWRERDGFCPKCHRTADGEYDLCTPQNPCNDPDCASCHSSSGLSQEEGK